MDYQTIKDLAKQAGRPVTSLIALAPQNDPFYQGTPATMALAEWFAEFYHANFAPGERVHVRRCHYRIVSLDMTWPDGTPYENTDKDWDRLNIACKAARYLGLVDINAFDDRKNDAPADYSHQPGELPGIDILPNLYLSDIALPDFPWLPSFQVKNFDARQPYLLEVWCEKTTVNDIVLPLCEQYGMVLQTGQGEISISAVASLAKRIQLHNKPARVFYVSDFDPAGMSMPVAISRKIEFFVRQCGLDGADIRLFPIVLTAEQARQYALPRTPIKETEKRKGHFEQMHGAGATELDALEALLPGELHNILLRHIHSYYDTALQAEARAQQRLLEQELERIQRQAYDNHQDQLDALQAELDAIKADIGPRMEAYAVRVQQVWQAIGQEMQDATPDLDEYPVPEGEPGREVDEGLYNSQRDYLDQVAVYKTFQGKAS